MTRKKITQEENFNTPQTKKEIINSLVKKKQKNKFLTENQKEIFDKIKEAYKDNVDEYIRIAIDNLKIK